MLRFISSALVMLTIIALGAVAHFTKRGIVNAESSGEGSVLVAVILQLLRRRRKISASAVEAQSGSPP